MKLISLLIALTALVAAAPASAGHPGCSVKGARVVAAKGDARVLAKKQGGGEQFYGCLGSSGKLRPLAVVSQDPGGQAYAVRPIAFAGRLVAVGVLSTDDSGEGSYADILVVDLATGRKLLDKPAGESRDLGETAQVPGLVLRADGRTAWIAQVDSVDDDTTTYVVRAFDGRRVRTLARGERIGRTSLKLTGSTVSWTDGGARKSATL
jgi:hypothetical protein